MTSKATKVRELFILRIDYGDDQARFIGPFATNHDAVQRGKKLLADDADIIEWTSEILEQP